MTEDTYFDSQRFRSALQDFVLEYWDNPNQAAKESGIVPQDVYAVIKGKNDKLLQPWQVNALLNCAQYKRGMDEARFRYWHRVLHRELIFLNTLSAWLYNETDGRVKDPEQLEWAKEHNQELKKNLAKDFVYLEQMVDRVFKAGGMTWSFTVFYVMIRRAKRSGDLSKIIIPPDWQIYVFNAVDIFVGKELPEWEDFVDQALEKTRKFFVRGSVILWRTIINFIKR